MDQSRWVKAPRLRYEVWKLGPAEPQPIDPTIAMLNIRVADVPGILKKAASRTSARNCAPLPMEMR